MRYTSNRFGIPFKKKGGIVGTPNNTLVTLDNQSKDFIGNWLNNRRSQLLNNIKVLDSVQNPNDPHDYSEERINSEIGRQTRNMNRATIGINRLSSNEYGKFDKNKSHISINERILGDPTLFPRTITHERAHSSKAFPQEYAIKKLMDSYNFIPAENEFEKRLDDGDEVYSRLMMFRKEKNLDPNYKVTPDDLKLWKKELNSNKLSRYPKKLQLDLFNTIASNNITPIGDIKRADWGGALTGASTGFKMGSSVGGLFGPIGGAIGGGVGIIGGALFGNSAENKRLRRQREQDNQIAQLELEEENLTKKFNRKNLLLNDSDYLNNFKLNNRSSLFMSKGGTIHIKPENRGKFNALKSRTGKTTEELTHSKNPLTRKRAIFAQNARKWNHAFGGEVGTQEPWDVKWANKQINEYRKNAKELDSLNTNYLTPALLKKYKLSNQNQINLGHSLNQSEIDSILSKNEGSKMYRKNLDFFSKYLNYKKYNELTGDVNDVTGTNENNSSTMADKMFGKRVSDFANNIPNITIPIVETRNGESKVIKKYRIYEPTDSIPRYMKKANGGKIAASGIKLKGGNRLITNNQGGLSGTHESGQNIPIRKNGKTLAYAEPGEVLVTDEDITKVPFILSKRLGFADKFMELENIKTNNNNDRIEDEQSKLVNMNNRLVSKKKNKTPLASGGLPISRIDPSRLMPNLGDINSIRKYSGTLPIKKSSTSSNFLNIGGLDTNSIIGAAGTIGNLLLSKRALRRQSGLIKSSLDSALKYTPTLNKNYLLNDSIDVNDSVSGINQGYNSVISGLQGIDPAIASAVKNVANNSRIGQLNSVFANRNNTQIGIRNQNISNIAATNNSNNNILNQTALAKLNAKITANEQLGDLESARLSNTQGAISEFNTILRDKDMMASLKSRWKDSIGSDFIKAKGGKVCKGRRKRTMAY